MVRGIADRREFAADRHHPVTARASALRQTESGAGWGVAGDRGQSDAGSDAGQQYDGIGILRAAGCWKDAVFRFYIYNDSGCRELRTLENRHPGRIHDLFLQNRGAEIRRRCCRLAA